MSLPADLHSSQQNLCKLSSKLLVLNGTRMPHIPGRGKELDIAIWKVTLFEDLLRATLTVSLQAAGLVSELLQQAPQLHTRRNSFPTAPVTPTIAMEGPSAV